MENPENQEIFNKYQFSNEDANYNIMHLINYIKHAGINISEEGKRMESSSKEELLLSVEAVRKSVNDLKPILDRIERFSQFLPTEDEPELKQ